MPRWGELSNDGSPDRYRIDLAGRDDNFFDYPGLTNVCSERRTHAAEGTKKIRPCLCGPVRFCNRQFIRGQKRQQVRLAAASIVAPLVAL